MCVETAVVSNLHGTFIIMNLAQNVLLVLSKCVCVCVCVCVELLKRSKTCTRITLALFWQYINLFRGADLTSGFPHVHLFFVLVLAEKEFPYCNTILAGGQSSLMLLCPTKLCIKEGSQG